MKNVSQAVNHALYGFDFDNISVCDENQDLVLLHYVDGGFGRNTDPIRGWVLEKETGKLVCKSFPFTPTIIVQNPTDIEKISNQKFKVYVRGTIIRIFKHRDTMYYSTHHKLNCKMSRWMSQKTFMDMFNEACEKNGYDRTKFCDGNLHVMLLVHPENQITYLDGNVDPHILHLESYDTSDRYMKKIDIDLGIPIPQTLSKEEAILHMTNGGNGLVSVDENLPKINIFSPRYAEACEIIGTGNSLFHRYTEILPQGPMRLQQFLESVPDSVKEQVKNFPAQYDKMILDGSKAIHEIYHKWLKEGRQKIDQTIYQFFCSIKGMKVNEENIIYCLGRQLPTDAKKICKKAIFIAKPKTQVLSEE